METAQHLNVTCYVIPALNEEASVGEVVSELRLLDPAATVLVVDDLSSDLTATVAARHGAKVLSLADRLGPWGATQTGLRMGLALGHRWFVTLDADGQHLPSEAPKLFAAATRAEANVVIGGATQRGSSLRTFAWSLMRAISGIPVADLTSGFRLYDQHSATVLASQRATYLDHQDVGVLATLLQHRLEVAETEVTMNKRKSGQSRIFSSWATVFWYMLQTLLLGAAKRGGRGSRQNEQSRGAI